MANNSAAKVSKDSGEDQFYFKAKAEVVLLVLLVLLEK